MKDLWEEIMHERIVLGSSDNEVAELYCRYVVKQIRNIIEETQKSAEQWKAIAEKLAEYLDKMCDCVDSDLCHLCPLHRCEVSAGNISKFAIQKAKKELGYE